MKLAVSNIAWKEQHDEAVYTLMRHYGFTGLEIAPTRFFPEVPYSHLIPMQKLAARLRASGARTDLSEQSVSSRRASGTTIV